MQSVIGALKHYDRLDTLSIGTAYWTEKMAQDQDEAIRQDRDEAWDKEIERFMDNALGAGFEGRRNPKFIR